MAGAHDTAAVLVQVLCTPYNHAPCHFMQSHIRKECACLAVTCHLHFWQNDRDLLRATALTRRWNGYRNKSQHRKLTLKKKILPPLQQGFESATFQSRVRRSNHWAIPAPRYDRMPQGWRHWPGPLLFPVIAFTKHHLPQFSLPFSLKFICLRWKGFFKITPSIWPGNSMTVLAGLVKILSAVWGDLMSVKTFCRCFVQLLLILEVF